MLDESTGMKWSYFYAAKDDMVYQTCVMFNKWKDAGMKVKYVRYEKCGEKNSLDKRSNGMEYEYRF